MIKAKITLNFINQTKDSCQKKIVIFQKQQNPDFNRNLIAWKVITFSGEGGEISFPYSYWLELSVSGADGIFPLKYPVQPGFLYEVSVPEKGSGYVLNYQGPVPRERQIQVVDKKRKDKYVLNYKGPPFQGREIQVFNSSKQEAIDLFLYRSGLLLSKWHNLLPANKAIFEIQPILYLTIVLPVEGFEVEEGEVMSPAVLSLPCAQFSLEEIKGANFVAVGTKPKNYAIKLHGKTK
jgi:hypothetical protein